MLHYNLYLNQLASNLSFINMVPAWGSPSAHLAMIPSWTGKRRGPASCLSAAQAREWAGTRRRFPS